MDSMDNTIGIPETGFIDGINTHVWTPPIDPETGENIGPDYPFNTVETFIPVAITPPRPDFEKLYEELYIRHEQLQSSYNKIAAAGYCGARHGSMVCDRITGHDDKHSWESDLVVSNMARQMNEIYGIIEKLKPMLPPGVL